MVPLILLVAALLFASVTVVLAVVGLLAIAGHVGGGVGGGIATIVISLLPLYLAYLLGRSAWRIRVSLTSARDRSRQRSTLTAVVGYVAILIASDVMAPVPSVMKVAMTVVAVLVFPFLLAAELEPRK
jgi:hypothetical protein